MANELDRPMVYQIRIKGHLDRRWAEWFGDVTITLEDNGNTLLTCPVVDQAALHGLLRKIRDLGMPLISAIRVIPLGESDGKQQVQTGERTMTTNEKTKTDGMAARVERGERTMATSEKESKRKITASKLIRWTGLAALVAGLIFAVIQPIHPPDVLSSVTTGAWAIIQSLKLAMCLLFLLGIAGLYARQIEKAGWLGLAGFLLLSLCWWLQTGYVFANVFILPQLATAAPQFVEGFLGIANGNPGEMNIGAIVPTYGVVGFLYMLGGLLFGIATLRAGVLPRWPAGLLAVAATLTPAAALLPHDIQRLAAIPVGLALAWLGYALWSERREQAAEPVPSPESPQRRPTAVE